jgi:glucokinase
LRALAIDVGGTKLAAAVVSAEGDVVGRHQVATPDTADGATVFGAVCAAADGALRAAGMSAAQDAGPDGRLAGIGVATAGPVDAVAGTVSPVNIGAWRGFPLRDRLAERYGLDVRMFGDGIAMVIAEHWLGAARGADNVLGMVVSTGVGGGLIQAGRVVFGAGGNAGHIGHVSVDPAGPNCACGGVGCLEAIASGTSLARWYAEQRGGGLGAARVTAADVARAARAGDGPASAAFERAAAAIGLAVAGAVTLLDLERVVIGGGVARAFDLLAEPLDGAYRRFARLGYAGEPRVVRAALDGDVGVLGAAAVVLHPARYWPL